MCGGSSEDVQVGERALESAGFTVDHGAPGIRSSFGHVALQVSNFNEATPEAAKAFLVSTSCDWLSFVLDNKRVPSLCEIENMIGVDLLIDGLALTRAQKLGLALECRVWTQALVDANDQIPLDAVNAAFQGLVLQRSRR